MTPIARGVTAPDFVLRDQHGVSVQLSQLRGRPVLVVFFPFAFSPVCSGELDALQQRREEFAAAGVTVLAISCDPVHGLRAWSDSEQISVSLLSDFWPHGAVASSYGSFDSMRGAPRRVSVLVDADGAVAWTVEVPLNQARSVDDQLAAAAELTTRS